MGLTCQEAVHLQVLYLAISTSCCQSISRAKAFTLTRLNQLPVLKRPPKRIRSLQEMVDQKGEKDPGHKVHRVRRSWLSDYLDDLWTHIHLSFPRGALYAFPVAVGVILLLCCATILVD